MATIPPSLTDALARIPSGARSGIAEVDPSVAPNAPRTDPPQVLLETRGVIAHRQGEFWARQSHFKAAVVSKLRTADRDDLAAPLDYCHTYYTVVQCVSCGSVGKFPNRCDHHECPECQPRLAHERVRALEWWIKEVSQPKHVVLTCRNVPELHPGHVSEFKEWIRRLRRTKFARNWLAGIYSLEVTNNGKGWHIHAHLVVEARYIDKAQLSETWQRVTNRHGAIVDVRDCRKKDYLREVCKYAAKGSQIASWTPQQIVQFITAFEHLRTFGVFGSLHGKRTKFREWLESICADKHTCTCGCNQFRYYTELEWEAHQAGADDPRNFNNAPRPPTSKGEVDPGCLSLSF